MAGSPLKIFAAKQRQSPIAMVSLYDAPTAALCCEAGVDAILIGDSMGNVILGYDSTVPVDMDDMAHHTAAVARGVKSSARPEVPIVADLPFGSYHGGKSEIAANGARLLRAGAHAVKVEGGNDVTLRAIELLTQMGAPVMGHLGFTPQSVLRFEETVQGKTASNAEQLLREAKRLEEAGCFGVVLEAVTSEVAQRITDEVKMATIGIGAGLGCDGQVLVWHDLAGLLPGKPFRFVKQFAQARALLVDAARAYVDEVHSGNFPAAANGWAMSDEEREKWNGANREE
jgi:3-methyl-2-oxobutanoate hydroxymethyltransferase